LVETSPSVHWTRSEDYLGNIVKSDIRFDAALLEKKLDQKKRI
jgi:hypothetical protein